MKKWFVIEIDADGNETIFESEIYFYLAYKFVDRDPRFRHIWKKYVEGKLEINILTINKG